jgi:hypothetical protein
MTPQEIMKLAQDYVSLERTLISGAETLALAREVLRLHNWADGMTNAMLSTQRPEVAAPTPPTGLWMIHYEEPEMRPEVFFGEGAEQAARARYAAAKDNWSCHLLSRWPDSHDMNSGEPSNG